MSSTMSSPEPDWNVGGGGGVIAGGRGRDQHVRPDVQCDRDQPAGCDPRGARLVAMQVQGAESPGCECHG